MPTLVASPSNIPHLLLSSSLPPSPSQSSSPSSTAMTSAIHKPVSTRRGSVSASDAYAKHAHINVDPNRSSSSILTIVRVPPPQQTPSPHNGPSTHNMFQPSYTNITLQDPPSTHISRRHGHHHGHGPHRRGASQEGGSERMSFAFTSFNRNPNASNEPPGSDGRSSPTSSPRLRPSSPTQFHQHTRQPQLLKEKPRLTPDQLVDLARQSTDPNALPPSIVAMQSPSGHPQSPGIGGRTHSPSRNSYDFSPSPSTSTSQSLSALNSAASTGTAPATFTPLPDDIYLPFIDRPSEVSALISNPPSSKLLALLAQTFPKQVGVSTGSGGTISSSPIPPSTHTPSSSVSSTSTSAFPTHSQSTTSLKDIPNNPLHWTFAHLQTFLTTAPRTLIPDFLFIILIRKCMMAHSELIWERLKGALGVPVELDVDVEPGLEHYYLNWKPRDRDEGSEEAGEGILMRGRRKRRSTAGSGTSADAASVVDSAAATVGDGESGDGNDTDDIDEDEGRKAFGYWEDWDSIMDSPVWARRNSVGSLGGVSLKSLGGGLQEDSPAAFNLSDSVSSLTGVSIEPLLLPTPAKPADSTPSAGGGNAQAVNMSSSIEGLQDIGEEEEEDEEVKDDTNPPSTSLAPSSDTQESTQENEERIAAELARERELRELTEMENDPDLVYPSRIQGLKIKTQPVPQDPTGSPLLSAVSVSASPNVTGGVPLPSATPGLTNIYDAHQAINASHNLQSASTSTAGLAHGRSASFSSLPVGKSSGFFATEFLLPSGSSVSSGLGGSGYHSSTTPYGGSAYGVQRSNSSSSLYKLRASASTGTGAPPIGGGRGVSAYLTGRPTSIGSSAGLVGMGMSSRRSSHGSMGSVASLDLGDRRPGNPLFPSNFARLAGGPTLNANNPALRSASPSTSRFNLHHIKPRSRPPSRSSTYSYTSSASEPSHGTANTNAVATEPSTHTQTQTTSTPRRAAGVINSGAGMALGILPGGVIVKRRE